MMFPKGKFPVRHGFGPNEALSVVKGTLDMMESMAGDLMHGATSGFWNPTQQRMATAGRILDALPASMQSNLRNHTVDEAMERFAGVGYGVDKGYQASRAVGGPDSTTALLPGSMARTERFATDTETPTIRDIRVGAIDGMQHSGLIAGQRSRTTDFGSPRLGMKVSGAIASQLVGSRPPLTHRLSTPSAFTSKTRNLMYGTHDTNIRRGLFNSGGMLGGMYGGNHSHRRGFNSRRGNSIGH